MNRRLIRMAVCVAALAAAPLAFARAYPLRALPAFGATVATAPQQVRIWFDSSIQPVYSTLTVTDSAGKPVSGGNGAVDPKNRSLLETALTPNLPAGTYMVQWSAVAADGNRTSGHFSFTVK